MEHFGVGFVDTSKAAPLHGPNARQPSPEFTMKLALSLLLAATLATPLATLAAESHDHGAAASHPIELNAGKKWATDAPLRKAMQEIKASVDRTLPAAHAGKAKAADFDAFGQAVTAQIGYIVENCKLDPKADAQLHAVIAEMVAGADMAQGKQGDPERASGVVKIAQALNTYGAYFQHPGWKATPLPH